ncbi:hypothetical protein L596_013058 [Steinernema carpocapsae]|nr:hypothetical protein L596_013058 [Steinernema carpocapsae]
MANPLNAEQLIAEAGLLANALRLSNAIAVGPAIPQPAAYRNDLEEQLAKAARNGFKGFKTALHQMLTGLPCHLCKLEYVSSNNPEQQCADFMSKIMSAAQMCPKPPKPAPKYASFVINEKPNFKW